MFWRVAKHKAGEKHPNRVSVFFSDAELQRWEKACKGMRVTQQIALRGLALAYIERFEESGSIPFPIRFSNGKKLAE